MNEQSCPECRRRASKIKLVLAWASVLGGAASLVGAGAAIAQVFFS